MPEQRQPATRPTLLRGGLSGGSRDRVSEATHDAYVSIGWDELFYVGCDACPGEVFGPTDNEFEANGKALDHDRDQILIAAAKPGQVDATDQGPANPQVNGDGTK